MTSPIELAPFRKTSDDFFAAGDYQQLTRRSLDLAFVDGLHSCDFALRDILYTERLCSRRGTILVHDIVPGSPVEASRERTTDTWMGDVFRAILAWKQFRPDLPIAGIGDIPPPGIAVVTSLNPKAPATDRTAAEHFMMKIDFERDFERLMRPFLVRGVRVQLRDCESTLRSLEGNGTRALFFQSFEACVSACKSDPLIGVIGVQN